MKFSLSRGALTLSWALVLLVAGPGFALGSSPAASAGTCTTAGGVSVVVDFREIGGTTVTACSADGGGKSAAAIFASVGVDLGYATRQPGFVCRVNGAPASDPCVNASPANAYWGLWWADGTKASWTYSSYGVGGLTVPAGGSVGWSWQQDRAAGTSVPPVVPPPVSRSSTPTASPSPSPSSPPTASPSSQSASTSPTSSPSPQATPSGSRSASEPPVAPESPGDSRTQKASGDPSDDPTLASESPSDSSASERDSEGPLASESPSDSSATDPTSSAEAAIDAPPRIPAAVTWSVLGLLAIAIAASAALARRRRGV